MIVSMGTNRRRSKHRVAGGHEPGKDHHPQRVPRPRGHALKLTRPPARALPRSHSAWPSTFPANSTGEQGKRYVASHRVREHRDPEQADEHTDCSTTAQDPPQDARTSTQYVPSCACPYVITISRTRLGFPSHQIQ